MSALNEEALISLFKGIGLDEKKAQETLKNRKLSTLLSTAILQAKGDHGLEKTKGSLLYTLASTCSKDQEAHIAFISDAVSRGDLKSDTQIAAALNFVKNKASIDTAAFNESCGVGVVVSPTDITQTVHQILKEHEETLLEERYQTNIGKLLKDIKARGQMKWADGKLIKESLDAQLEALLGPKSAQDSMPKKKPTVEVSPKIETDASSYEIRTFEGDVLKFHKPGENPQPSEAIRQKHLAATGGKVVTRFPPEPNGYLHIGHAKAINFSFNYAKSHDGITYLRYDDTNPEAEEEIYFKSIAESVRWLGYTPYKVTCASDYFSQLYEFAVQLVKGGHAYVCHQTQEEIEESRGGKAFGPRTNSPWRDRPIEENLELFEKMKAGHFEEGQATLRLKQDMQSPNPRMWDLVAYRVIKSCPHVRTGWTWCIYPSYDFTHCICDSLENITHSLCTLEFISAREPYYWILDKLQIYKPVQWEYGRLSITNTLLSKRKITKLVSMGIVNGWDDPRLYTLAGIRRRGFTPRAVNQFVEKLGITTVNTTTDVKLLESTVRDDLNRFAPRRMAVLHPLRVVIENLPEDHLEWISLGDFPTADASQVDTPDTSMKKLPFTRTLYIEQDDFSVSKQDDPHYYRLTPKQPVGLYKVGSIRLNRIEKEGTSDMTLYVSLLSFAEHKPKCFVQWVADAPMHNSPVRAEVRLYDQLFNSSDPDGAPGGFLNDINPNSLVTLNNAAVDCRFAEAGAISPESVFQFQRIGYFCIDADSTANPLKLVFNKTVSLREDPLKN